VEILCLKKNEDDFIENLNTVKRINTSFVIASATIKTARNGKDYLELSLTDKTGEIIARMFPNRDAQEIFENINQKRIYQVQGNVDEFPRNSQNFSIKIDSFQALDETDYHLDDFIRTCHKDPKKLIKEIKSTMDDMKNPHLKISSRHSSVTQNSHKSSLQHHLLKYIITITRVDYWNTPWKY
jgi:Predicted HD-superfamily hydrolase